VHEIVAVPDPAMLVLLGFPQLRPLGVVAVRDTVPVNPLRPVIVIVVVLDWPTFTAEAAEAVTVKSAWFTANVVVVECVREPLVPITVSV
jgi:hypothetical protein